VRSTCVCSARWEAGKRALGAGNSLRREGRAAEAGSERLPAAPLDRAHVPGYARGPRERYRPTSIKSRDFFHFYIKKKLKFQKYMAVSKNFKIIPLSPPGWAT